MEMLCLQKHHLAIKISTLINLKSILIDFTIITKECYAVATVRQAIFFRLLRRRIEMFVVFELMVRNKNLPDWFTFDTTKNDVFPIFLPSS